jgi:hypothetical protein
MNWERIAADVGDEIDQILMMNPDSDILEVTRDEMESWRDQLQGKKND